MTADKRSSRVANLGDRSNFKSALSRVDHSLLRQGMMVGILVLTDLTGLVAGFLISFLVRRALPIFPPLAHDMSVYVAAWPILFLWPVVFWREGLYPGLWEIGSEQLKKVAAGTTLAALISVAATFVTKTGPEYSRPIIVGTWATSLCILPIARMLVRRGLSSGGVSGPLAVILGAGATGSSVIQRLSRQHPPALTPVAFFDDDPDKQGRELDDVPVLGPVSAASSWALSRGVNTMIVAMPGVRRDRLVPIIEQESGTFSRVIVVPDLFGLSSVDTDARDIGGILAVEIRKNLLSRWNRLAKRLVDLVVAGIVGALVLPLAGVISAAILVESGRPLTFGHQRVGINGGLFTAWKFRTMVNNADAVLEDYLALDPAARLEWESTQKLKRDPRLTFVGRVLRRFSLDELPQLWNVFKGDMSLVGPRPIVESEKQRYGDHINLYLQVLPGLTGLWQVSGRSTLAYEQRVELDSYYIRNWSIWLDLVILARTVWVVMLGIGAY